MKNSYASGDLADAATIPFYTYGSFELTMERTFRDDADSDILLRYVSPLSFFFVQ